ncbi:NADH-quinone oxidoreductase subunit J [Qipengyuania sediminis]|uniref:NADH-quinone oxidoreductase subunit J n=1 Tax=Qipengyuania sediminis TaxID=1532023 RepID=UPI0010594225|nr:NADH-quinone oxidoreductase subunit J [Qipengyuania sediminis]
MIQTIAFYLFAGLLVLSAGVVITARNPVHSVLWLILAFFNAAGLMVLVGAEFIAMLVVIVYVGAVAVLFLFVVMMLDIDFAELRAGFVKNFPLGLLIALVLLSELTLGIGAWQMGGIDLGLASGTAAPVIGASNTEALGAVLYRDYLFLFEAAGLVLLVAMVGAIVLTHREGRAPRGSQDISKQVARRPEDATVMRQPQVGQGINL